MSDLYKILLQDNAELVGQVSLEDRQLEIYKQDAMDIERRKLPPNSIELVVIRHDKRWFSVVVMTQGDNTEQAVEHITKTGPALLRASSRAEFQLVFESVLSLIGSFPNPKIMTQTVEGERVEAPFAKVESLLDAAIDQQILELMEILFGGKKLREEVTIVLPQKRAELLELSVALLGLFFTADEMDADQDARRITFKFDETGADALTMALSRFAQDWGPKTAKELGSLCKDIAKARHE